MNFMKTIKFFTVAILLSLAQIGFAQSKSDRMYDTFSDEEGVLNFSFSKNMKDFIDIDLDNDNERKVTGDLNQVRFMAYNPNKGNLSGTAFTKKAISLLPGAYKKYDDSGEDLENAQIWLLGKRKKYSECHLFFESNNENSRRFVVSFYGEFTVNDLDALKETGKNMAQ